MGLEKLVDFLLNSIRALQFWTVVRTYENGVLYRLGHAKRVFLPGLHFIWPFYIDEVDKFSIAWDTTHYNAQTILTKDGQEVSAGINVTYRIVDVMKYATEVEDGENALIDISLPAVRWAIGGMTWEEVMKTSPQELDAAITSSVRSRQPGRWGLQVASVGLAELGRVRGLRLWQS